MGYRITAADYLASLRRCPACNRAKDPEWFAEKAAHCLICERRLEKAAVAAEAKRIADAAREAKRKAERRAERERYEAARKEREAERREEALERSRFSGENFWAKLESERQSVTREEPEEEPMGPLW